jgi:hypothetical protein
MAAWRMALRTALFLSVLVIAVPAVEVTVQIPDPLVTGVVVRGSVTIENATARVERVDLPPVDNLEWQARRGSNYEIRVVNGTRTTRESVTLVMRVQPVAELTIPAITVVFDDGSTAVTKPQTVRPQPPDTSLSGEALATATFEPSTIVPGEPAVLVYRLALRQDRVRAIKQPALTPPAGLLVTGDRSEAKSETTDTEGREWAVQTWRWPVTAAMPGTYEARGQQEWYRCRQDFFNQLVVESTHQVPIKPGVLTVTPLPDAGRPDDFSGLIGPLAASAAIERNRIATGEGTVFTVTLTGPQVGLGHRPNLALPTGVQAYPKDDDSEQAGTRKFRWDLVPANAGELTLPAITFSYFDPNSRSYKRATTEPLTVTVIPGRSRELKISGAIDPAKPLPVAAEDVRALPPPLHGSGARSTPMDLGWPMLIGSLLIGLLIGLGQRWHQRPRRGPHRGRALAGAIVARDLDAMARCVFALRPDLDATQRQAADALERAIDQARFGAADTGNLAELARPLVEIA